MSTKDAHECCCGHTRVCHCDGDKCAKCDCGEFSRKSSVQPTLWSRQQHRSKKPGRGKSTPSD